MGFVPHLFKNTSILIRTFTMVLVNIFCISLFASNVYASTKILVWGDSLSAAYGIPVDKGWVSLLEIKLGNGFDVVNGSISGETTQGGLTRLPAALTTHNPDFVFLILGANDGLRGIPPQITKNNLQRMIEQSKQVQAEVVLFGMKIPPNYGIAYSEKFETQFAELASDYDLPFLPFFLKDIIENLDFFQADELHPTAEAQPIILETILPILKSAFEGTSNNISESDSQDTLKDTSQEQEKTKAVKNPA